jgi:hypothetical protein
VAAVASVALRVLPVRPVLQALQVAPASLVRPAQALRAPG